MEEFKISHEAIEKLKQNAKTSCVLIGLAVMFLPPIVMIDIWKYALIGGMAFVPIAVWLRWRRYKNERQLFSEHALILYDNKMVFKNKNSQFEININTPKRIDINLKKSRIDSIRLTLSDKTKILFDKYEAMDDLAEILKSKVASRDIKYHHWFHYLH